MADNGGLIKQIMFDSAKECADECTLTQDCQAFDWFAPGIQSLRVASFTSQESSQEAWMMGEFAMHQFVLKLVEIELVWVVTKKSF